MLRKVCPSPKNVSPTMFGMFIHDVQMKIAFIRIQTVIVEYKTFLISKQVLIL